MKFLFFTITSVLLMQSVTAQVNLQTGAAEQSFPLINYVDGKAGLSLNVGLAYSSGNGLLVNDVASDVGTGWSLDAGGIIMRVQNGEPDDQMEWTNNKFWEYTSKSYEYIYKNYPNGYMYNPNVGAGCSKGLNYYASFKKEAVYKERNFVASDLEQDKFIFRMNGHSGVFVIGKNQKVTMLGDSRAQISFSTSDMTSQGIRTRINQFVIITEDGIKYTFKDKSISQICRYKWSYTDDQGEWHPNGGSPGDGGYQINRFWGYELPAEERPFIVNSWFLSEMENVNTLQKVIFNYGDIYSRLITSKLVTHQRDLNNSGRVRWCCTRKDRIKNGRRWMELLLNPANADRYSWDVNALNELVPGAINILYSRSITMSKRISSITLPNGGLVSFNYHTKLRVDLDGENALSNIKYSINGTEIRNYKLEQGYFFNNTLRPYTSSFSSFQAKFTRLCLLSVQKVGTWTDDAIEPPYKFTYFMGSTRSSDDIVPARNFLSQDHWGYYNGDNSELPVNADHDFLPNQGNLYFKTVLPKYKNAKAGYAKNGLLKSVTYPTGGTLEYTYEQIRPAKNILPTQYTQLAGGVSVATTTLYDGDSHSKDIINSYQYVRPQSNISSHWGDESPNYYGHSVSEYNLICFRGGSHSHPGLLYAEMASGSSIDWGKVVGKALISFAVGMVVQYAIAYGLTAIGASSYIPYVNVIVLAATIVVTIIHCRRTYEYHRFILSNVNNNLQNPLQPLYSRVEVKSNSYSGNSPTTLPPPGANPWISKIVYEFTDVKEYPSLVPKLEWPYIQNQRLASWVYGNLKKMTVYNKDNQIVKETTNTYNYIVSKVTDNNNKNCKCATINKRAMASYSWDENSETDYTWDQVHWMTPRPYSIYTGRTELTNTIEKVFLNGGLVEQNVANFYSDPMTLLQKGKVVLKDVNELVIEMSYYPTDFDLPGAISKLKELNAIHTPVATETWLFKINNVAPFRTVLFLSSEVTEYKLYTFGSRQEVKPWRTYHLKAKAPIPASTIGSHDRNLLLRHPELFKLQNEMVYDDDGNLVQTISNDNYTSFINDYADRYVTASVSNALYSDIAYSSFESNRKGNWNFNTTSIENNFGLTGTKSLQLSATSTISRSNLDVNKTYSVTYWVKDQLQVYVNGAQGELLYQVGNWHLFKSEVSNTSTVTITGNAIIDEVRLYPKGALMSTVCYKEGIGKIADCDVNNRLLFYEYDGLGRMKLIRDQNKNIIKTYEYNYKN